MSYHLIGATETALSVAFIINAARNMVAAGQAVLACGEAVRPGAVKTKPGKPLRGRKPNT